MIEVEVKVELRDRGEFQLRLLNLGALKLSVERQNDIYFKHPVIDFRATDEALRLRRAGGEVYLTYKGPKMMSGSKTREELNLKFNDFDTARRIFERLKFQPLAEIVKTRITYQLDDIKIYMDDVEELGCYAEFEILVKDNMEVETAERRIFSLIERLGFKPSHSITNSYLELMLKKRSD